MTDTVLPHVPMDGKELLRALMQQAQLSAADFALKLGMPRLQNDIQSYLDGQERHPSWAAFRPVAEFFNIRISALFDAATAEQVAQVRGLMQPLAPIASFAETISMPPLHLPSSPGKLVVPIYDVVVLLAAAIKPHEGQVRKTVGLLLMRLLTDDITPEETLLIAAKIEDLL